MCKMYGIIEELCLKRVIKPVKMCADLGISRGVMGDLKAGRTKKLSAENIEKVSRYFGVPSDYLLGTATRSKDGTTFSNASGYGGGFGSGAGFGDGTGCGGPIAQTKKAPTLTDERQVSDEDIKFALFGGDGEITDAMYDEVKRFAKMVKLREEAEREKK